MAEAKKEHILTAAESLFNRFGIKKTAVEEIASYANVAKGTIYNYFGNKEGLLKEILNKKTAQFREMVEKSNSSLKDPMEKLKVTMMHRLKILIENPFLSDKSILTDDRNIRGIFEEMDKSARKIISGILEYDIRDSIPNVEKNSVINTILFTLKGMEETIKNRFESVSLEQIEKDVEFLINSIFAKYSLNYSI